MLAVGLVLYSAVALLNYSVVQSYAGAAAGSYFSREWGATVRVGSLHALPWDHLVLHDVLMVAPDGDTVADVETLRIRFSKFPFVPGSRDGRENIVGGLYMDRVYLGNGYYHFESYPKGSEHKINLWFITEYYAGRQKEKAKKTDGPGVFVVDVGTLTLNRVRYKMDLPDHRQSPQEHGVEIPHMEFRDVRGKIVNIHVENDDVRAKILRLSTEERSGFKVKNISGDVHVSSAEIVARNLRVDTPKSHIELDADLQYGSWHAMGGYLGTVMHKVDIGGGTTVAMSDVAYWAPVLWGIDVQLTAEGRAWGTIDSLVADSLHIGYGRGTTVDVVGSVAGLPDIERTVFDVEDLAVRVAEEDVQPLLAAVPVALGSEAMRWVQAAAYADVRASARGGLAGKAAANVNVACALGSIKADAATATLQTGRRVVLDAESDMLDLRTLGTDWLQSSGFALSLDATLPQELDDLNGYSGEADVELFGSVVRGYRLSGLTAHTRMSDGRVEVEARCGDELADFEASATLKLADSLKCYMADIDVRHLQPYAFGLLDSAWGEVSAQAVVNFKGNSIDEMQGGAMLYGVRVGEAYMEEMLLQASGDSMYRTVRVECDAATAEIDGRFSYSDLGLIARQMMATAMPTVLAADGWPAEVDTAKLAGKYFDFNAQWIDDGRLLSAVSDNLAIARGTRVSGSYNSSKLLRLVLRSDSVRWGSVRMDALGMSGSMVDGSYRIEAECPSVWVGKEEMATDVDVRLTTSGSGAELGLVWGRDSSQTHGDVAIAMDEGKISAKRKDFYIGGTHWTLDIDDATLVRAGGLRLKADGIGLECDDQRIGASVNLMGTDGDNVVLDFDNFRVATLSEVLLANSNITADGSLNGRFVMYGIGKVPFFNANLAVDSCVVNRQPLGDVAVVSNWNAELNILNLQLASDQLQAHGWIGLDKKDPDLNFAVDFDGFDLAVAEPLMASFASRFDGLLHGSFDVGGTTKRPYIIGEAMVESGALKLDMTGVTYYFSDSIRFGNSKIRLDRFKVIDASGNIAFVDGTINYKGFDDVELDLDVNTDNLTVLDLPRGDAYRGTLLASAAGHVQGKIDDLRIVLSAETRPGCTLAVPVSSQRQVKSQNYITFVSDEQTGPVHVQQKKKSGGRVQVELDLRITPDLELKLPMDFSEVTVDVGAKGQGDLHLSIDGIHDPQVLGSYEITNGTMKLGMISLFEKNFAIESGSNLAFQGSVPDARFDLRAVYSQRVNLSTLTGSLSTLDNTQKYLQVENIIAIAGSLSEPTIGFDLRLPGADASVEEEVFAYIDRNSERDMINQTMSLLLMGQFYNSAGTETASTVNNGLSGGYSMMASSVSSIVSDMVQFVDVDVNYKAGNDMTKDQVDVNISKDWGKWYLESTFGYGGESRELEMDGANGTVLDALIGYRISPLVHLFAYNRTNTNDYTRMDLPYKQGVGLKLTKDFDRWDEVFKKKSKKKNK